MACTMALNRALAEGQRCRCALLKWASSPNPSSPNAACWPEMTSDQLQQVTDFLKSLFQLRRTLHRRDKSGLSRIELCFFDLSFRTAQGAPESSFVILFCLQSSRCKSIRGLPANYSALYSKAFATARSRRFEITGQPPFASHTRADLV